MRTSGLCKLFEADTTSLLEIYSISNDPLARRYESYKNSLSLSREELLFHGTESCDLSRGLCNSCSMCRISETGFKVSLAQTNISWDRFGRGIYFAPNSSKGHDYNQKSETPTGVRFLIVSKVALGRQYKTKRKMRNIHNPPIGYDSILGQPGKGLNYPEAVVYRDEAALPCYIIKYTAVTRNRDGCRAAPGQTGKYYCGRKVLSCFCCDGHCGPNDGCNCSACQWLDQTPPIYFSS